MPARNERRQRSDLDIDTSEEGAKSRSRRDNERQNRSRSKSPPTRSSRSSGDRSKRSDRKKDKDVTTAVPDDDSSATSATNDESLSIEETNKLRAKLGLAPLEVDEKPKIRDSDSGDPREKIVNEDGFEFVHKAPENIAEKKHGEVVREKLQTLKAKRDIHSKVLKSKGIAEDAESEPQSAAAWVEKSRKLEEEKKMADKRAKMLQEMDEEFGIDSLLEEVKKKTISKKADTKQHNKTADAAGLLVEHSKEAFLEGRDTVLVLKDKDVLDEGEEMLINPNLIDNERYRKNVELRKRKDRYRPFDEEVDEFGEVKKQNLLAKYDDELEGEKAEMFRLDESGSIDVTKEAQQLEIKRRLGAAAKNMESLERSKFTVASEFYTEEEMATFKKPKKPKDSKKIRKRGSTALKPDDLLVGTAIVAADEDFGSRSRGKGRQKQVYEDGEVPDEPTKVIAPKPKFEYDDDDGLISSVDDLIGFTVDDEAEDELAVALDKARKLKQKQYADDATSNDSAALQVRRLLDELPAQAIKQEAMDTIDDSNGGDSIAPDFGIVLDATSEYCRNLGEIPTYGLAGNRIDAIDIGEIADSSATIEKMDEKSTSTGKKSKIDGETMEVDSDNDDDLRDKKKSKKRGSRHKDLPTDEYEQAIMHAAQSGKGVWVEATATTSGARPNFAAAKNKQQQLANTNKKKAADDNSDSDEEFQNVLGEEADVAKGVGAMLKLAGQKGYLESTHEKLPSGPSLKHLVSKRFSVVEPGKYDIDEKYTKKLERMGTTGSGPIRPFPEMREYKPEIHISYTDKLGREMDEKDAFRHLSWKFHGKGPGKKQIEKRMHQVMKKELMKKMNSSDTPLGTLDKQRKKQEKLQTPYLVLSGAGKETGAPLKKD